MKKDLPRELHEISSRQWEQAFLRSAPRRGFSLRSALPSYEKLVDMALSDASEDVRTNVERLVEAASAGEIVEEVLEAFKIADVGVDFPFSTHGDGISIGISRFPDGTVVGRSWDTTYGDSGNRSDRDTGKESRSLLREQAIVKL